MSAVEERGFDSAEVARLLPYLPREIKRRFKADLVRAEDLNGSQECEQIKEACRQDLIKFAATDVAPEKALEALVAETWVSRLGAALDEAFAMPARELGAVAAEIAELLSKRGETAAALEGEDGTAVADVAPLTGSHQAEADAVSLAPVELEPFSPISACPSGRLQFDGGKGGCDDGGEARGLVDESFVDVPLAQLPLQKQQPEEQVSSSSPRRHRKHRKKKLDQDNPHFAATGTQQPATSPGPMAATGRRGSPSPPPPPTPQPASETGCSTAVPGGASPRSPCSPWTEWTPSPATPQELSGAGFVQTCSWGEEERLEVEVDEEEGGGGEGQAMEDAPLKSEPQQRHPFGLKEVLGGPFPWPRSFGPKFVQRQRGVGRATAWLRQAPRLKPRLGDAKDCCFSSVQPAPLFLVVEEHVSPGMLGAALRSRRRAREVPHEATNKVSAAEEEREPATCLANGLPPL